MFTGHWLKEYIIPIYNNPNLEKTMDKTKITIETNRPNYDKNNKHYPTVIVHHSLCAIISKICSCCYYLLSS